MLALQGRLCPEQTQEDRPPPPERSTFLQERCAWKAGVWRARGRRRVVQYAWRLGKNATVQTMHAPTRQGAGAGLFLAVGYAHPSQGETEWPDFR
jgi:hypothetical protein